MDEAESEPEHDGPVLETVVRPALPVDLDLSLRPALPPGGRVARRRADGAWGRPTRTPSGPAATFISPGRDGIRLRAWGPGAAWAIEAAPGLLGARDSLDGFDPPPGLVRELHHRMPGLRIVRTCAVVEAMVSTVLAQKVTGSEAGRAWSGLVRAFGEPAPGPGRLLMPPAPEVLAALPYHAFHPFGVEMRRANVVRGLAARAARLETAAGMPFARARRFLTAFPGVGAWTAAEVALSALGDADAVSVGDFHLPNTVCWALAGEARGSDERMLELLEPYRGQRGRVQVLIEAGGITAPKFGPRVRPGAIEHL